MNNHYQQMKKALIKDVQKLNIRQLFNLICLLEREQDSAEDFGIDLGKYYTCAACYSDHNGCSVVDTNNFKAECYSAFHDFCKR